MRDYGDFIILTPQETIILHNLYFSDLHKNPKTFKEIESLILKYNKLPMTIRVILLKFKKQGILVEKEKESVYNYKRYILNRKLVDKIMEKSIGFMAGYNIVIQGGEEYEIPLISKVSFTKLNRFNKES